MAFATLRCPHCSCEDLEVSVDEPTQRLKVGCTDCATSQTVTLSTDFAGFFAASEKWR